MDGCFLCNYVVNNSRYRRKLTSLDDNIRQKLFEVYSEAGRGRIGVTELTNMYNTDTVSDSGRVSRDDSKHHIRQRYICHGDVRRIQQLIDMQKKVLKINIELVNRTSATQDQVGL